MKEKTTTVKCVALEFFQYINIRFLKTDSIGVVHLLWNALLGRGIVLFFSISTTIGKGIPRLNERKLYEEEIAHKIFCSMYV